MVTLTVTQSACVIKEKNLLCVEQSDQILKLLFNFTCFKFCCAKWRNVRFGDRVKWRRIYFGGRAKTNMPSLGPLAQTDICPFTQQN